jgi:hypothetical protein
MLLLTFAMLTAISQLSGQVQSDPSTRQPVVLVQRLYTQVVSLHPIGVTKGADMTTFAPYLCEADWFRQHPETGMKPDFGWLELGLFSGDEEMAEPSAFEVEKTQTEKDGTVRVNLKLTHAESNERPWTWQVAAIVRREDGRYVVDDVIYLKDKNNPSDVWLSKILSNGCSGPRWVGEGNQR